MSSSLHDKLHRKISDYIVLKNRQLRSFSRFVLDCEFLLFAEFVEDSERFFEEFINNFESHSAVNIFLTAIERRVVNLCRARELCLRKLEDFERLISNCKDSTFEKIFYQRLKRTTTAFQKSFRSFQTEIEDLLHQLPDIYQIAQFQNLLNRTTFLYLTVVKNHENIRHVFQPESQRLHVIYNVLLLKLQVNILLHDLLIRHSHLLEDMDSDGGSSLESIRGRLNQEITKSRTEIVIQEAELTKFRQELFPSEISLKEQRDVAIGRLEVQELDLEHRIRSIDLLQSNIHGLEEQVAQLVEERERVHNRLMAKRDALRGGIREIVRLEKLIQKIEKEISDRMVEFQERLEQLELKRLAILEDDTLTDAERARLLAELEEEITMVREKHDADQQLLKDKCEELKALSRSMVEDLDAFRDELTQKHLDEIRELEEQKMNATPSELELINSRIAELQREFEENMEMLEQAQARPKFYEDEHGRYYINEFGQKVYQRESGASEYILTGDGLWEKIKDALEKQTDEKGEYYIDSFGKKIYTKKYFEDDFGKYYIDSDGRRVYLEASIASETESKNPSEGQVSPEILTGISEEAVSAQIPSTASELAVSEEIRRQRASDVKYIQDTLGLPLRKGLALTFLHQPEDPIEFLARFLEKYDKDQKKEEERTRLMDEVKRLKENARAQISKEESAEDVC